MKKLFVFLTFMLAAGISTADAQSCGKSAAAGKSCCASRMAGVSAADKAAAADASIFKNVDANGVVFFTRKETDAAGNARFVSVRYDEATNAFVNVAPRSAQASMNKKVGSPAQQKACAGSAAGKACCRGGAQKQPARLPERKPAQAQK